MTRRELLLVNKIMPYIVDTEIDITDFGTNWPFSNFPIMNQARVINGDGVTTVSSYSYVNNQPSINSCPVISVPSFPAPYPFPGQGSPVTYTVERNSNANTKSTVAYSTPLGDGYYKHTVTLSSPLLLEAGKQYCFMVRNQGYYGYRKVGTRNGTAIPNFGVYFDTDLSNYDASAIGTTWMTWYEARFSYVMEHPYYLELNGISV